MQAQQRAELAADEGTRLLIYDDATGRIVTPGYCMRGHPTIGVGRALDVHGLTVAEADLLFANDIAKVEQALGAVPWFAALDPVRQGVLVNLAFNMGIRGLQGFVAMIADLEGAEHDLALTLSQLAAQQFTAAANELAASKWARQVQPSRRDRLILQLRTGEITSSAPSPAPKPLPVAPVDKQPGSSGSVDNRPAQPNPKPPPVESTPSAATEALNEVSETEALNQAQVDKGRSP
jgi:lysozyme